MLSKVTANEVFINAFLKHVVNMSALLPEAPTPLQGTSVPQTPLFANPWKNSSGRPCCYDSVSDLTCRFA